MKKICMVAYTNYLSDARPRREAETLAGRGDRVDFIALGEKDRPSLETVQGVRVFRMNQLRYRRRRRPQLRSFLFEVPMRGHDEAGAPVQE